MKNCSHENWQYTRRYLKDGVQHFFIQCVDCRAIVKHPEHQNKLFIKADEIPQDAIIHPWIDGGSK